VGQEPINTVDFKPNDYYQAARERIKQARDVYRQDFKREFTANHHPVAYYHCGVAVECMLRAFITLRTKDFDGRHDLMVLLDESGLLGLNRVRGLDERSLIRMKIELGSAVQSVNRLWINSLRYASEARIRSYLHELGLDRGIKGDPLKENLRRLLESSTKVIDRGVMLWESRN
jgi:HEPN domain-containing protein